MTDIAVLSANLGNFDTPVDPPEQTIGFDFHRYTDEDFAPITGLTPRLQYRIPKTHGWQMKPGYKKYLWLDGSMTLAREDSLKFFADRCEDMVVFRHPDGRNTIREEVEHIEQHLIKGKPYITSRYKNGLHKEQWWQILQDDYVDENLYASTVFMYRNTPKVQEFMKEWLYTSVRYFTCDQIALPYLIHKHKLNVNVIEANQYKFEHLKRASHHS